MSADPTFVWKFVDIPKRSETGLKPSETVGKQLYPLILLFFLLGAAWVRAISADPTIVWKFVDIPKRSETGLKQV